MPPGAFEQFWEVYPHKVGKRAAREKFAAALRRTDFETLMAGLARYVAKTDDRPWCNPAVWLNQDRWEDQPAEPVRANGARAGPNVRQMTPRERAADNWSKALGSLDRYAGTSAEDGGGRSDPPVSLLPPAARR